MTEFGLAILLIGALLVNDRERLEWISAKVRELSELLST